MMKYKTQCGKRVRIAWTHNISSIGKSVNAFVGTRCSIFPSSLSARKFFSWFKEISSKCITALLSSCLASFFRFKDVKRNTIKQYQNIFFVFISKFFCVLLYSIVYLCFSRNENSRVCVEFCDGFDSNK